MFTAPSVTNPSVRALADAENAAGLTELHLQSAAVQDRVFVESESDVAHHIADGFADRDPDLAARHGFRRWQRAGAAGVAAVVVIAAVLWPSVALLVLAGTTTLIALMSFVPAMAGLWCHIWVRRNINISEVPDEQLPTYTVLVPAYEEHEVIGDLIRCLAELDYPIDRLEVLLLVERRDTATQQAIMDADRLPHMRIVHLPPGKPQTKPRSCNAGLMLARGELLVIFDAEDRPERDQLRRAAEMFAAQGDDLACLQATLLQANGPTNVFTRCNALEYALRYRLTLPGLAALGAAFPLGGTSNHFRTRILREIGGWDAWNVSEDADLGMRCRALGYRTDVVDTITYGEAPDTFRSWLGQHTRWHKGYLLTALVHTREPRKTLRRFGPRSLLALMVTVLGTPLQLLLQPAVLALATAELLGYHGFTSLLAVDPALIVVLQLATILSLLFVAVLASPGPRRQRLAAIPLYPVLHWIAGWRALHQLVRAPFLWEKTTHRGGAWAQRPHSCVETPSTSRFSPSARTVPFHATNRQA
jgi:glycosyltransferase XagB